MITKGKLKGTKVVVHGEEGREVFQVHGHTGKAIVETLIKSFGPMASEPVAPPKRRGRKPKAAAEATTTEAK